MLEATGNLMGAAAAELTAARRSTVIGTTPVPPGPFRMGTDGKPWRVDYVSWLEFDA